MTAIQRKRRTKAEEPQRTDIFKNAVAVALFAGVSEVAIQRAVKLRKLRQEPDGTFLKASVDAWIDQRCGGRPKHANEAEQRLKSAKADMAEMERDELRGALIRRAEANRQFTERAYEIAVALKMLSRRLAGRLAQKTKRSRAEVSRILDDEVRALFDHFSRPIAIEGRV